MSSGLVKDRHAAVSVESVNPLAACGTTEVLQGPSEKNPVKLLDGPRAPVVRIGNDHVVGPW